MHEIEKCNASSRTCCFVDTISDITWWCHGVDRIYVLLALGRNPDLDSPSANDRELCCFFVFSLNKLLKNTSGWRWFGMPCHSCDGIGMIWQTVMCLVVAGDVWCRRSLSWWRHQTETFAALLALLAVNSPVTGEFPAQRPVTRNFDVFFDLRLNKRLSKQSWGSWFETTSRPLWRHSNVNDLTNSYVLDRKQWNQHAMSPHN